MPAGGFLADVGGPITGALASYAISGFPPEVEYVYSGAEFNEAFGPVELVKIARQRAEARQRRRRINRARYRRRYANHGTA